MNNDDDDETHRIDVPNMFVTDSIVFCCTGFEILIS